MDKFYKIGDAIMSEAALRTHSVINTDGQLIVFTYYKIDAGSPESAKRALDAIARVIGAEDLLAPGADKDGDEKNAAPDLNADGWHIWSGGECPVDEDVDVVVMQRDGVAVTEAAGILGWEHERAWYDIVAYRPVEEKP